MPRHRIEARNFLIKNRHAERITRLLSDQAYEPPCVTAKMADVLHAAGARTLKPLRSFGIFPAGRRSRKHKRAACLGQVSVFASRRDIVFVLLVRILRGFHPKGQVCSLHSPALSC